MMKRAAVIGATSPLGIHLVDRLVQSGYVVRASFRTDAFVPERWKGSGSVSLCYANLEHLRSVNDLCKGCEAVVWLAHAWQNRSEEHEDEHNISTLLWFLQEIDSDLRKMVFISSGGAVYGEPLFLPIREDHPRRPLSHYGKTKKIMEDIFFTYGKQKGLRIAILRPGNIYGTDRLLTREKGLIASYFRSVHEGKALPLIADGMDVRDFIHVSDVVRAIVCALEAIEEEVTWNVGTGVGSTVRQIIEYLGNMKHWREPGIVRLPRRESDVSANVLSTERISAACDWKPLLTIEEGLRRTVETFKEIGESG